MTRNPASSLQNPWCRAVAAGLAAALLAGAGCSNDPESRLTEIRAMQSAGQFEESIQNLRVLLASDSSNPEANYRLGVALVQTGRRSLAIWPLQKAAQSDEYAVQGGLLLASTLMQTESYEEAIRAADRVLEIEPDHQGALYARAHSNIGASRPDAALEDAERLLELDPDDTRAFGIRAGALVDLERYEEAEQTHLHLKELALSGDDEDKKARTCAGLALFYQARSRVEEAETHYAECLELYPTHPTVQQLATDFYTESGRGEKAIELWKQAVERNPEDLGIRSKLADLMVGEGRSKEAAALLEETVELFDTRQAWQMLASFHRKLGDNAAALAALEEALERTTQQPAGLRFALADLLITEGELDRAQAIADEIEEPSYQNLLNGSIALARGKPEEALKLLETGLRLWPNNSGARHLAGRAARAMGDFQRAAAEFREAVRVGETETDAGLDLARLYFSLGQYEAARQFAERHIMKRPFRGPEAHMLAARAASRLGRHDVATNVIQDLLKRPGQELTALIELSEILRSARGPEAALATLEGSQLDLHAPENAAGLRALAERLADVGRLDDALSEVDQALARQEDVASLHDLKARLLAMSGRDAEARQSLERALELDPGFAPALEAMGTVAAREGELDEALEYFDRAYEADPSESDYAYRAAQTVRMLGDEAEAVRRLRELVLEHPGHVGAANDLAWRLAEDKQELDFALELASRAVRVGSGPDTLDTLGWVQLQRDDTQEAVQSFKRALEQRPDDPSIRYRLGVSLSRAGDDEQALAALREALTAESFPEAEAARQELAKLEGS